MEVTLRSLCLVVSVVSLFSSCSKDKDETDPFINSSWNIAMLDDNTATNPPGEFGMDGSNQYHPWMSCQQDDSFTFSSDGQLHIEAGSTFCEGGSSLLLGPSVVPYEYDREKGEVKISGVHFTIAEITGQRLKLYRAVSMETGINYIVYLFQR